MRRLAMLSLLALSACGHDRPYDWTGPDPREPFGGGSPLPRRITFNPAVVPGADSTIAFAVAPGGGYWLVKSSDSTQLLLLAPNATSATPVATFSGPVTDIANVDGVPVAVRSGGLSIEWPGGGYDFSTPVSRVVAVPGKRLFVAEIETSGIPLAPDGANLWLFGLP